MKYFMFVDIKKVNLDNLNLIKLNEFFPKINIRIEGNEVTYEDKNKEKILIEKYIEDKNNLKFSEIYFSGNGYNQEFIGYKFFSNDIVLIIIKNSFDLYSDFSFYEKNEGLDYMKIINDYIFSQIDLNNYNISGYKLYLYFFINALIIKLKNELFNNGIKIKIINDKIDDFINNYIKQTKSIYNDKDKFIFIYSLLFKGHSAVLVDITGILYLFDPSHYFNDKMNIIFKNLKDDIITINIYKIQNLGVCSYYSIIFINIIIEFLIKNKQEVKNDDDKFIEYINSNEFVTILVNKLNEFFRNNEKLILIKDNEANSNNEIDYKYLELSKNIFINRNIYKIIFIDLEKLFEYINYNYDKNDFDLILKKNKLYLNLLENKYLYEKLLQIISIKLNRNNEKYHDAASKQIFDYKLKKKVIDNNLLEEYVKKIYNENQFYFVGKQKINEIKKLLKEELIEGFNDDLLDALKQIIKDNICLTNKQLFILIKDQIKKSIESQLISNIFLDEFNYYNQAYKEILSKREEFKKEQENIIEFLDQTNNNNDSVYKTQKVNDKNNCQIINNKLNEYINKLDKDRIKLEFKIEEFN
jgi:hypothetical protein